MIRFLKNLTPAIILIVLVAALLTGTFFALCEIGISAQSIVWKLVLLFVMTVPLFIIPILISAYGSWHIRIRKLCAKGHLGLKGYDPEISRGWKITGVIVISLIILIVCIKGILYYGDGDN